MLSFTLLGSVVISKDAIPLTQFRSQKEAALLIYLAHTQDTYQREFIADLLWESSSTKQALSNLRTIIARMRKQLGNDAFDLTRKTIGLNVELHQRADSAVLLEGLRTIRGVESAEVASELQTLLKSYTGEFCSDFYLKDGNNYNYWLTQTQEEIRREVMFGYEKLGSYAQSQQNGELAIEVAQEWLKIDELNEAPHILLIRSLIAQGNLEQAKAQYEHCKSVFKNELGLAPPAEATALINTIQTVRHSTAATTEKSQAKHNLPAEYDQFFGRESDIRELHSRLNQPNCRLVTIGGAEGVGKSRLAVHVGWERLGQHRDGVWRADLSEIPADDPDIEEAIAVEIAIFLELRLSGDGTPAEQLITHLKQQQALLLLDNMGHLVAGGTPLVLELIQQCPHLKIIITSTIPLEIAPEWLVELSGLAYPAEEEPSSDTAYPAVELFIARRAQKQHRPLEPHEHAEVHKICQLVQGHPLALELTASLTQFMSVGAIVTNLSGGYNTNELSKWIQEGEFEQLISAVKSGGITSRLDRDKVLSRLDPLPDQKLFGIEEPKQKVIDAMAALDNRWLVALDGLGGIGKTSLANAVVHHFIESDRFLDIGWVSAKQDEYVTGRGIQSTRKPALDAESLVDQLLAQLADGAYPTGNYEAKRDALTDILRKKPSLVVIDNLETVADYEELLPLMRHLSRPSKILITTRMSLRREADVYCLNLSELPKAEAIDFLRHEAATQEIGALEMADEPVFDEIYQTIGGNPLALKLAIGQAHFLPIEHILNGLRNTSHAETSDLYVYIYWQAWQMLDTHGRHLFVALPMVPNGSFEQLSIASGLEMGHLMGAIKALRYLSLIEVGQDEKGQARYRIHRLTETFLLNEVIKWQQPDSQAERQPESEQFEERLNMILEHWQSDDKIVSITTEELDQEKDGILKAIQFGLDFEPSWPLVKQLIPTLTGYMERRGHWAVWYDVLNRGIEVAQRLEDLEGELMITNMRGRILQLQSRQDEVIANYWHAIRLARKVGNEIEEARACSNLGYAYINYGNWWRSEVVSCHALAIFEKHEYQHGIAHTNNHLGVLFIRRREYSKAESYLLKACDIWRSMSDEVTMIRGLQNLALMYNETDQSQLAIPLLKQAMEIVEATDNRQMLLLVSHTLAVSSMQTGDISSALNYASQAEQLAEEQGHTGAIFQSWECLGLIFERKGLWDRAENYMNYAEAGFHKLNSFNDEFRLKTHKLSLYSKLQEREKAEAIAQSVEAMGQTHNLIENSRYYAAAMSEYEALLASPDV